MDYKAALVWAQNLSDVSKGALTALLIVLTGGLLVLLWQKPPLSPPETRQAGSTAQSADLSVDVGGVANAPMQTGQGNIMNAPAINQSGATGGVAQANTGGVNLVGGTYYAAPATPEEKAQQLERLKNELAEVASYPDKAKFATPTTILEQSGSTIHPLVLADVLFRYYRTTIVGIPDIGQQLLTFKEDYYKFGKREAEFENRLLDNIGSRAESKLRAAWIIQLKYSILRVANLSPEAIRAGGDFLNFGLTWESVEEKHAALVTEKEVVNTIEGQIIELGDLQKRSDSILDHIRRKGF